MLAEQAEAGWLGDEHTAWVDRFDAEHDNLRAALGMLESAGQADSVLELVGRTRFFWASRGAWLEGLRWVEPALERTKDERSRRRARALGAAGMFAFPLGNLEDAKKYAEDSVAIFRELGDSAEIGRALGGLGAKVSALGDVAEARRLFEEAAVHLRAAGERFSLALVLGNLADLAIREADYQRAESLLEEALVLYREVGHGAHNGIFNLAFLRYQTGRHDQALSAAAESLALSHEVGDSKFAILSLVVLGALATRRYNPELAARLLGAAEAERTRISLSIAGTPEGDLQESTLEAVRGALGVEAFETAFAEGRSLSLEQSVALATADIPHGDGIVSART